MNAFGISTKARSAARLNIEQRSGLNCPKASLASCVESQLESGRSSSDAGPNCNTVSRSARRHRSTPRQIALHALC